MYSHGPYQNYRLIFREVGERESVGEGGRRRGEGGRGRERWGREGEGEREKHKNDLTAGSFFTAGFEVRGGHKPRTCR
jgi:hypothetical protein